MVKQVNTAEVWLWDKKVGAIFWDNKQEFASFEYSDTFLKSGLEISPLTMPLRKGIYLFTHLDKQSYLGLPGLLADVLPDKFGNAIINQWLTRQGRDIHSFNPVERLCYIGKRGMGALEFRPALNTNTSGVVNIEISELVKLANEILTSKKKLQTNFKNEDHALNNIIRVGTSAGGARAKAVIAWNPKTEKVMSGQLKAPNGFEYWLLKFDGVANSDKELLDPQGFGKIEYAYYLMAIDAGIEMMPSRLLHENGRSHFMTKRFDRLSNGNKLHMQSLCAMCHYDFNQAGAYGYEQALQTILRLQMGNKELSQQYRRMVFNIISRNQDDHTKNIAYVMNKRGKWRLSPAYDITYSYNPQGAWTAQHQMSCNGKRDNFLLEDLLQVATLFNIRQPLTIIQQVTNSVKQWKHFAKLAEVEKQITTTIADSHRLYFSN